MGTHSIIAASEREMCAVIDTTATTPDLMAKAEKEFGKEITTRTYKTVQRILQKMA